MQQHAVPEPSMQQDEEQDALRLQVEQIIAQRLERRNLTKPKPEAAPAAAAPEPPARPTTARRASPEPDTIANPLDEEFGAEFETNTPSEFAPLEDLPELKDLPAADAPPPSAERRISERRQAERRNVEFLRTELQWSASGEDDTKRGFSSGLAGLKRSRLVLLGVALMSALVAAALALNSTPPPAPAPVTPAVVAPVTVPTARILVAASTIGAGERLGSDNLSWHEVPAADVLPEYVAEKADPEALATTSESVARYPFFPGDPIRTDKLVDQAQRSLATSLKPGMRGVSVVITPDSAAGGFIRPDDYVDVVLVTDSGGVKVTRTILENARVIALNAKLGPSLTGEVEADPAEAAKVFEGAARATLELSPKASEVLVRAAANGPLTLTLRPQEEQGPAMDDPQHGANQAIRLTSRFWTDTYSPGMQ